MVDRGAHVCQILSHEKRTSASHGAGVFECMCSVLIYRANNYLQVRASEKNGSERWGVEKGSGEGE